jgi:hypothetical protein
MPLPLRRRHLVFGEESAAMPVLVAARSLVYFAAQKCYRLQSHAPVDRWCNKDQSKYAVILGAAYIVSLSSLCIF